MADPRSPYSIRVPKRLPRVLSVVVVVLLAMHLWTQIWVRTGGRDPWDSHPFADLFDADTEMNVPTWYSGTALLLSSALLLAVARAKGRRNERDSIYWHVLAAGFCVLSLDEIASFHEAINTVVVVDWEVPFAAVVAVAGLFFVGFLFRLPPRTRYRFLVAGAVFLGGALGLEHFAGAPYIEDFSYRSLKWAFQTAAEEGMEMFGIILFIRAILDYMSSEMPGGGDPVIDIAP